MKTFDPSQAGTDPASNRGTTGAPVEFGELPQGGLDGSGPRHDTDRKWQISLVHYDSWDLAEYEGKPVLLPDLNALIDRPGGAGTRAAKDPKRPIPNTDTRDGKIMRKGGRAIPKRIYLRPTKELDTDGRPWYYLSYERVRVYSDGTVSVKNDPQEFTRFRVNLIRDRMVNEPSELAIDRMRNRWADDADRATTNQADLRAARRRERAQDRLHALDEAYENTLSLYRGEVQDG